MMLLLAFGGNKHAAPPVAFQPPPFQQPFQPPPQDQRPNPQISVAIPGHLEYQGVVAQLRKWNEEAPQLTEVGTYGKSSRGTEIAYIKITNKGLVPRNLTGRKPTVLITACIHGNEPHSASTVMAYIGTMLDKYGEDQTITGLIDSREIYFVPVVSPDSYPHSRHVDGVDPNRNFPTESDPNRRSVPPVQALREFFLQIKPNAVISGHTWGRVFLIPYGDKMANCPHHEDYMKIVGEMGRMSNYRVIRACDMYQGNGGLNNPPIRTGMIPIYGSEVDWYYRNGAMGVVMEFGTHQRIPSMSETKEEFQRTFHGVLHFIEHAPLVIKN